MIDCSKQRPKQQTGASSAGQTSLPNISAYESIDPSRSDVVYDKIEQSPYQSVDPSRSDAVVYDQIEQSPTYQSIDPSRSDVVVYDQIARGPETASPNRHLYSNVTPKNNYENVDVALYSD